MVRSMMGIGGAAMTDSSPGHSASARRTPVPWHTRSGRRLPGRCCPSCSGHRAARPAGRPCRRRTSGQSVVAGAAPDERKIVQVRLSTPGAIRGAGPYAGEPAAGPSWFDPSVPRAGVRRTALGTVFVGTGGCGPEAVPAAGAGTAWANRPWPERSLINRGWPSGPRGGATLISCSCWRAWARS